MPDQMVAKSIVAESQGKPFFMGMVTMFIFFIIGLFISTQIENNHLREVMNRNETLQSQVENYRVYIDHLQELNKDAKHDTNRI